MSTALASPTTGGQFQIGPDDGSSHRLEVNIRDMRASGAFLNLESLSVAEQGLLRVRSQRSIWRFRMSHRFAVTWVLSRIGWPSV